MVKEIQSFNHETNMDEKLVHSLLDINHMMRMLYEGKASQSRILIILYERSVMLQKELIEYLGIQPGSASEILSKLEKAGLIKRTQSEADGRAMEIVLTDIGKTQAEEAMEQRRKRHEQMFICLTHEEQTLLFSLLQKLSIDWNNRFMFSHSYHRDGYRGKHIHEVEDREE